MVVSPRLEVRHDPRSSHLGPAERQDRRIQTGGKRVLRHAPKKIRETSGRETTDLRSSEIRTPSVDSDEGERGSDQKETGENADLRSTEAEAGTWGRRKFDEALQ